MNAFQSPETLAHRDNPQPGRKCDSMLFPPQCADSSSAPEPVPTSGISMSTTRPSISDKALKIAADEWTPPPLDLENENPSRIRDFYLGGDRSFAVDRDWCTNATRLVPPLPRVYRDERDFLSRAIRFATQRRGIHRFLVLGAGLPFARPVHDDVLPHPHGRVVYVEPDDYVAAHLKLFAQKLPQIAAVQGDFLEPGTVLFHDSVHALLRTGTPIGLVLTGVLETIADTRDAIAALKCFTERLPPGSVVVVTHATVDGLDTGEAADAALAERRRLLCRTYGRTAHRPPCHLRTAEQLREILAGLRLVQPGITHTSAWHSPRPARGFRPAESLCLAAVAGVRKPRPPRSMSADARVVA
ncbi:SAM-dependent methyltransferase [Amycolatopsis kentuckyensis]|uniref:SAM-dependent methyltransferase n=1 Tax=Amycolatopsis kentuckyensis TaxID=218823 RepID=UPI003562549C